MGNSDRDALARRERLNEIYRALWSSTRDAEAPPLTIDDHVRATKTLITLGADPAENPIFAKVQDRALAEEYAALLIEEANAQEEGAKRPPEEDSYPVTSGDDDVKVDRAGRKGETDDRILERP